MSPRNPTKREETDDPSAEDTRVSDKLIDGCLMLQLLRDHKSTTPQEIWDALGITKQGAMKLMQPLLDAGLVQRIGTRKTGRYILA